MKSLFDYDVLVQDVFYRNYAILDYIDKHKPLSPLDEEAIKATIMDALVYKRTIDPAKQSLDFEHLCIVDNLSGYQYEKHPFVCGIPLWMKEKLRKECLVISGGAPVTFLLSKPESKISHYCLYDPCLAVSKIFSSFRMLNVLYDSPTREGVRIENKRPFLEVDIDGCLYLIDVLTKRIFKSDAFSSIYHMEIVDENSPENFTEKAQDYYEEMTMTYNNLGEGCIPLMRLLMDGFTSNPAMAEYCYEFYMTKKTFPEEWKKAEQLEEIFNNSSNRLLLEKTDSIFKK